ncbi:MAG: hypothetical protein J1F02_10805 [Lachnospiraceae bacterium]|nr:hypothetical protein [Lachnospiraceae bacterium]
MKWFKRNRFFNKSAFLWLLAATLFFAGIHAEKSSAAVYAGYQNKIPLSAQNYRTYHARLYHDISTSEITGGKSASVIIDCAKRGRKSFLYRQGSAFCGVSRPPLLPRFPGLARGQLPLPFDNTLDTVIRYIHNQDGEKGSSFL